MISPELLQEALKSDDFAINTQCQIAKDFGTTGIELPIDFLSYPLSYPVIIESISIELKKLETSNPSMFSQLLYLIDLPESLLPELIRSENYYYNLSEQVLKREAYKVFLRQTFRY